MNPRDHSRLTSGDLIAALDLPDAALINQRVAKKLLLENASPTAADRKLIQNAVEEITWVAALKPTSIGVPEYRDEQRSYLEVAVLATRLRETGKVRRLAELIHRAIPYPVMLVFSDGNELMLSLAHIRCALNEVDETVLDGEPIREQLSDEQSGFSDFLQALSLRRQPRTNLRALYQGWIDTLTAWQVRSITGCFVVSSTAAHAAERRAALHRCQEIDDEVSRLRLVAKKEKQMARQVTINLNIQALLAEREQAAASL